MILNLPKNCCDHNNKTSLYLNNWYNNQRLKKNSPFSLAKELRLPLHDIEPHSLKPCLDPSEGLPRVHFNFDLAIPVNKKELIPAHLRQLALEIINTVPKNSIKIYTDGSKLDRCAGSGIYIEKPRDNLRMSLRNPDSSSVFRSELIAIDKGLEAILHEVDFGDLWIFSDSRSSLQHLYNWTAVGDQTSISILHKLKLISETHNIFLQWIPSHVDIYGNEQADSLAKEGCCHSNPSSSALTFLEHQSIVNCEISKEWRIPPSHHWYAGKEPGSSLNLNCDRATCTAVARLASGHLKCLSFSEGKKTFATCPKCQVHQSSPEHVLKCVGLSKDDVFSSPLLVIDFLRVNDLLDLV